MIQYFHRSSHTPPPWLKGAQGCSSRKVRDGFCFGVGLGHMLAAPTDSPTLAPNMWHPSVNGDGPEPHELYRYLPWVTVRPVLDAKQQEWAAPIILLPNGQRAFKISYGLDWKPALTDEQKTLINYAEEAAIFLDGLSESGDAPDFAPACAWGARFLELSNHITTEVIQKLMLLDDVLLISVLRVATSRPLGGQARGN